MKSDPNDVNKISNLITAPPSLSGVISTPLTPLTVSLVFQKQGSGGKLLGGGSIFRDFVKKV